ncbi:MAG: DUF2207 domain-containing protein [Actinomycetota bacterium]
MLNDPRRRRRLDRLLILAAALGVGGVIVVAAFFGDNERIGAYWLHADVAANGGSDVVEVIDYDFGPGARRGIVRQIPDVEPSATAFEVFSPTAPFDLLIQPWWQGSELRVGNPDVTITGRHRYTIAYPHDGLVVGEIFSWNAIGDGWDVAAHDIEVHVTSERELIDLRCDTGENGEQGGCDVEQLGPGHALVRHDRVGSGRFLTVSAVLGAPVAPGATVAPTGPAQDPGTGALEPGAVAAVAALAGAAVISMLWRRAGREWVWEGGTVAAAFGPDDEHAGRRRVDHRELAEMTTIEFEAPRELSAAAGGVIHAERVRDEHKLAWLLECAIRGEIELETGGDDPEVRYVTPSLYPHVNHILGTMFAGRTGVSLASYDPAMRSMWTELGTNLDTWRASSGHWDETGAKRRRWALAVGALALIVGTAVAAIAAGAANRTGAGPLPVVGISAALRAWELRIRTPSGSGAWIRIESFRRFLHESEAEHVERAAEMGLLRQYTAWAVALDESDRWDRAVQEAVAVDGSHAAAAPRHTGWIVAAPALSRAVSASTTAPSSSGGGGGFGGGAGCGGGGGGGGSW